MKGKKFIIFTIVPVLVICILFGSLTAYIDPLFHYHKPLDNFTYRLSNQRYINDGIVKNFSYDAIITGTSMTENFRASEFNSLFGVNSIKVPFSGASFREIANILDTAFSHNDNIKYVLRGLDYRKILNDPDEMTYDKNSYPSYLYDDNLLNDVSYLFNKDIFIKNTMGTVLMTLGGKSGATDFDSYSYWSDDYEYGVDLANYERAEKQPKSEITKTEYDKIKENFENNIIRFAKENPDTQFYYFFTPYSILYWDAQNRSGALTKNLDAEKYAIELMIKYDNIHLFSFNNCFDVITNLDNYRDEGHYGAWINSQMLKCMSKEEHRLTKENYEAYCKNVREFFTNYNYEALFQK